MADAEAAEASGIGSEGGAAVEVDIGISSSGTGGLMAQRPAPPRASRAGSAGHGGDGAGIAPLSVKAGKLAQKLGQLRNWTGAP